MSSPSYDLKGSTLYRLGFAIFAAACLINAFDSYTGYVQLSNHLTQGGNPADTLTEALLFLALGLILVLEGVGLMLFKWSKRAVATMVA